MFRQFKFEVQHLLKTDVERESVNQASMTGSLSAKEE
jgi:hypothetical protein